jgi:hypothetical protein
MLSLGVEPDALVCAVCRALAHVCVPGAPRRALLLVPEALKQPALREALTQVAAFLDARELVAGGDGTAATALAPLCDAARELCARIPPTACAADFERVRVKYLPPRGAPPPPLLSFASHFHLMHPDEAPSWVGLVAPELLCAAAGAAGDVDAFALAAAVALLGAQGRGARPQVHAQLQAGGWESCGPAVQRLLQRACGGPIC